MIYLWFFNRSDLKKVSFILFLEKKKEQGRIVQIIDVCVGVKGARIGIPEELILEEVVFDNLPSLAPISYLLLLLFLSPPLFYTPSLLPSFLSRLQHRDTKANHSMTFWIFSSTYFHLHFIIFFWVQLNIKKCKK